MKSHHPAIRKLLRQHPDGLTVAEIEQQLVTVSDHALRIALKMMPDTYIDRWLQAKQQKREQAVWCIVVPPEDCPKPRKD